MNLRGLLYAMVCFVALSYLLIANARGYVPFASPATRSSGATANHFHK